MTSPIQPKKDLLLKWFKKYHKWPGLIFALFILLFSVSGIIMNHRSLFSFVDVNRKWLPGNYEYNNWNMAAVKSAVKLPDDSLLVFGNVGIWKTDSSFSTFRDFNKGFPNGIDNRKIYSLLHTHNHRLIAGTLFGLFEYNNGWEKINIPVKAITITDDLAFVNENECIGCGLCVTGCAPEAIELVERKQFPAIPATIQDMAVQVLQEKGRLEAFMKVMQS